MITQFFRQENKAYRNMQIVFGFLGLHFIIPSLGYFFNPAQAIAQLDQMGRILGETPYPIAEISLIWRVLAAGNVFTLGFTCFLFMLNVRKFQGALPVFAVLKGFSSLGFLYAYFAWLHFLPLLGIFLWDGLNVAFVLILAPRALKEIERRGKEAEKQLIPKLRFEN